MVNSTILTDEGRPVAGRLLIAVVAGERGIGTSVSAALLALAASARTTTLCIDASGRRASFRWRNPPRPNGAGRPDDNPAWLPGMLGTVTGTLDVISTHHESDSDDVKQMDIPVERLAPVADDYDTVIVDAGTGVKTLASACRLGHGAGAEVRFLVAAAPGGAGLAAAHAAIKGVRQAGIHTPATLLMPASDEASAITAHGLLDGAATRFLSERIDYAGPMTRDACLATALRGGMPLADAAAGGGAIAAAFEVLERLSLAQAANYSEVWPKLAHQEKAPQTLNSAKLAG